MTSDERSRRRKERLARNEALFREVNERVEELSGGTALEQVEFVCECGDESCIQTIPLTRPEYEQLRADPVHFAVVPGHEILEVENVVSEGDRFYVVRKHGEEQEIARATDPRS